MCSTIFEAFLVGRCRPHLNHGSLRRFHSSDLHFIVYFSFLACWDIVEKLLECSKRYRDFIVCGYSVEATPCGVFAEPERRDIHTFVAHLRPPEPCVLVMSCYDHHLFIALACASAPAFSALIVTDYIYIMRWSIGMQGPACAGHELRRPPKYCLMCSEAHWTNCHRSFISEARLALIPTPSTPKSSGRYCNFQHGRRPLVREVVVAKHGAT